MRFINLKRIVTTAVGFSVIAISAYIINQETLFNKNANLEKLIIKEVKKQLSLSNVYGSWITFNHSNKIFTGQIFVTTNKSYSFKANAKGKILLITEN